MHRYSSTRKLPRHHGCWLHTTQIKRDTSCCFGCAFLVFFASLPPNAHVCHHYHHHSLHLPFGTVCIGLLWYHQNVHRYKKHCVHNLSSYRIMLRHHYTHHHYTHQLLYAPSFDFLIFFDFFWFFWFFRFFLRRSLQIPWFWRSGEINWPSQWSVWCRKRRLRYSKRR